MLERDHYNKLEIFFLNEFEIIDTKLGRRNYPLGHSLIEFLDIDIDTLKDKLESLFRIPPELNISEMKIRKPFLENIIEGISKFHVFFEIYFNNVALLQNTSLDKDAVESRLLMVMQDIYESTKKCKEIYEKALSYCLDLNPPFDTMKDLDIPKRLCLFADKECLDFLDIMITKRRSWIADKKVEIEDNESIEDKIKKLRSHDITLFEITEALNLYHICYAIFMEMISKNLKVKKCSNCNKYFILYANYNNEYCNRLISGKNKTCKELGAILRYRKKTENDEIKKLYDKAYKTNYARVYKYESAIMSKSDFPKWIDAAIIKRNKMKSKFDMAVTNEDKKIIIEDFKIWLKSEDWKREVSNNG